MSDTVQTAQHEKYRAALTSVVATLLQTGMKLVVGILTGSLGILAEAAHSGFDLVAVMVTFMAIRISNKPPDAEHRYGHGKAENLSALFETVLLLGTCAWIIYEAVERLFFKKVHVEASLWAFVVMIVSIAIDASRSRVLRRAAHKHNSQALEADALHFTTDMWCSSVVILGLLGVKMSDFSPRLDFMHQTDAVAAIGVAMIVVWICSQLGKRSIQALLDRAPEGLARKIEAAIEKLPDVIDCHHVRVRASGPNIFVDVHVMVDGSQTLADAHALTEEIEKEVQKVSPGADVTVHPEPEPV